MTNKQKTHFKKVPVVPWVDRLKEIITMK
jgi:hypothetical protein